MVEIPGQLRLSQIAPIRRVFQAEGCIGVTLACRDQLLIRGRIPDFFQVRLRHAQQFRNFPTFLRMRRRPSVGMRTIFSF
jgi:hypothetical protein